MAITVTVAAYNAFDFPHPNVEFATSSPRGEWRLNLPPEDAPEWARAPYVCGSTEWLPDFEIKPGLVRTVSLCFLPDEQGKIAYYSGKEEADRLNKIEIAVAQAKASGKLDDARALSDEAARVEANLSQKGPDTLTGNPYDSEVNSYTERRTSEFAISPNMLAAIEKELPRIEREALFDHLKMVLSDTAYVIAGLWIFSFVIGWIIRGFAGIPRGQDFRPQALEKNYKSDEDWHSE